MDTPPNRLPNGVCLAQTRRKEQIGERSAFTGDWSTRIRAVASFVRALLISLVLSLAPVGMLDAAAASPPGLQIQRVSLCNGAPAEIHVRCSVVPLWRVDPQDRMIWLDAPVRIDGALREPLGIFIKAFAASEIYWDGQLIGRNGRPASSAALEMPGLRDAVIPIPSGLSRPGMHRLQLKMSTMRAPVRLASPVLDLRIAPFEETRQPALRNYLPALLTVGGMFVAILGLAFLAWTGNRTASLKYLIGAGLFTSAQLTAESSRAFVQLLYPAQILRLELAVICACGFGLLLAAYLCQRFGVRKRKPILAVQIGLMVLGILLLPGLDEKTVWVILTSVVSCMAVCGIAIHSKNARALPLLVMLGICLLLGLGEPASFLDRDFYIWVFLLVALLLVQEAQAFGKAVANPSPTSDEPRALWLGSGAMRRLVLPVKIIRLAAADDYTEVVIAGASAMLHPEPLHKLLERLPSSFVRVHRSHAVNLAHLESFRRGRRSSVTLSDRSVAPVSRRSIPQLLAAIST